MSPADTTTSGAGDDGTEASRVRKLSILIPVYNEIRTLQTLLGKVLALELPCEREIVIVDDCSTDGSREIIGEYAEREACIVPVYHERNQGKGAAIRTAIAHLSGDWAVIQDADLEYEPKDLLGLLVPVQLGIADAVFGSRFALRDYRRAMFFWHTQMNRFLTTITNMLADLNVTDMETCYKLIRADILTNLNIRSNGFDLEPELTIKLARWGARIYEVPISYRGRTYAEGKKIGALDAAAAFVAMLRYRFFDGRYCKNDRFLVLQGLQKCRGYNKWLFSKIGPHLGDSVLEVGAGIGNLTRFLLDKKRVLCLDDDPFYVDRLDQAYGHLANLTVKKVDYAALPEQVHETYASGLCINALELVDDDAGMLQGVRDHLEDDAALVVVVPQGPDLYCDLDTFVGHKRRYSAAGLRSVLEDAGFEVVEMRSLNRLGALGWRIMGKWLGRDTITGWSLRLLRLATPFIRISDAAPFHSPMTLVAVARKRAASSG